MKQEFSGPHIRLYRIAQLVLAAGLLSSVLIYFTAGDVPAYEDNDGNASYLSPEDSKRDMRGMEELGGTLNIAAYKFRLWFAGLWHGKTLAFTTAFLSVFIAYCLRFAADRLPSGENPESGSPDRKNDAHGQG